MINDPLLNQSWDPPTGASSPVPAPLPVPVVRSTKNRRAKHPAAASRIFAVGISVTAVISLSSAYAKAEKQQAALQVTVPSLAPVAAQAAITPIPTIPPIAPAATAPVTADPTVTVPTVPVQVVTVPVVATPKAQTPVAPTRQQSSGSR